MSPILMDAGQMVDMALGTSGSTIVNFKMLHALMHVIVDRLNFDGMRIEVCGPTQSDKLLSTPWTPGKPSIAITEYKVDGINGNAKAPKTLRVRTEKPPPRECDTILVLHRPDDGDPLALDNITGVVGPEIQPLGVVSNEEFRCLESRVDALANILPRNEMLLAHDGQTSNTLDDMWNMINLTKRVEATEIAIAKLTSLVSDLGKSYESLVKKVCPVDSDVADVTDIADEFDQFLFTGGRKQSNGGENNLTNREGDSNQGVDETGIYRDGSSNNLNGKRFSANGSPNSKQTQTEIKALSNDETAESKLNREIELSKECDHRVEVLLCRVSELEKDLATLEGGSSKMMDTIDELNKRDQQRTQDGARANARLDTRMDEMRQETNELIEQTSTAFAVEKELLQTQLNGIRTIVECLREHKVGKHELTELLSDKVDLMQLDEFATLDQLQVIRTELADLIEDVLNRKMSEQDKLLAEQIQQIQSQIDNKADKVDLVSLHEDICTRLSAQQERLQALATLHHEPEAAGAKMKFLRNLKCISCDQNVVMRNTNEHESNTACCKKTFTPSRSLQPYLIYKLDNVRKQQLDKRLFSDHCDGGRRKLNSARLCGGSHTNLSQFDRAVRKAGPPLWHSAECDRKTMT